ncbi:hypothetical protein E2562_038075 [Oryza meyeriana var. granulata]|uniref:Uncharacterized protein n=1 Tax=Oryza meyeriana var. granulata TaxID=110450 RepID=A0A6G1DCY6_9ORYZ|nr:hypothetical protein E2562_038075 [Oryza meyeriana var. granulata]
MGNCYRSPADEVLAFPSIVTSQSKNRKLRTVVDVEHLCQEVAIIRFISNRRVGGGAAPAERCLRRTAVNSGVDSASSQAARGGGGAAQAEGACNGQRC